LPVKKRTGKRYPKRAMSFDDLMRIERVSNPSVHPSGACAAYVLSRHDHIENTVKSTIMLVDFESKQRRELTPGPGSHSAPAWSPDGKTLAFVSDRVGEDGKNGERQIWMLPFEGGGEASRLTAGEGGASKPVWSPDGTRILFARNVVVSPHWDGRPDGNPGDRPGASREPEKGSKEENAPAARAAIYGLVNGKSSARIETSLLYRHWDHWREMRRSHLFMVEAATGKMADMTPFDADVPPMSLGGVQDYSFSPEGDEIVYVKNPDRVVATSTNNSIFLQKLDGNSIEKVGRSRNISTTRAMDLDPRYSPDGRYIAYLGAERPTYEADRLRVKLYDRRTGVTRVVTGYFDRSASSPVWSGDGKTVFFLAPDLGYMTLYGVDIDKGRVLQYTRGSFNADLRVVPGKGLLVTRESAARPADIYHIRPGRGLRPFLVPAIVKPDPRQDPRDRPERLTYHGDWLEEELDLNPLEGFWYRGADGDPVHGFILKPPHFNPGRRYPAVLIVHGGPQSAFFDHFHYRWNPQLFAAQGWVVIELNPRGSVGYGQGFADQISGDWGGRCYEDIMKGLDHCTASYRFINPKKIAAAGASFGGFMMNWIAGHTDRFRCLVSHDGIFNAETMAYMTEELWFDRWEHGGFPHEDHERFLKYSPHMHVQNFRTPMLVIQGEQDFRCPVSEGISLFTALQVMKVPSRLLYFPDEGHWVTKPANAHVWYHTVLDFIKEYMKGRS